jgi:hypothetical protein
MTFAVSDSLGYFLGTEKSYEFAGQQPRWQIRVLKMTYNTLANDL